MTQPRALNAEQRKILSRELAREDLAIYTVVRMAKQDVAMGLFDSAIARLRIDADKLRMHQTAINDLVAYQYPN